MSQENGHLDVLARDRRLVRRQEVWVFGVIAVAFVILFGLAYWTLFGATHMAIWRYSPEEGDVIFQSLPPSPLVAAIEGATASPFSHCGIVTERGGKWMVLEALNGVEMTPLSEFIHRGREGAFAVYRFREPYQSRIPAVIDNAELYLGRPYDSRYDMDDEKIYCSELIFKAYRDASEGDSLGELVPLGNLHWRPFRQTIERYEGGPPPLERLMITPKHLSRAKQLRQVFSHVYERDHH